MWIPPLRERPGEIIPLAQNFIEQMHKRMGREEAPPVLSARAQDALLQHTWPGNIRELKNAIARAVVLVDDKVIHRSHLGLANVNSMVSSVDTSRDFGPGARWGTESSPRFR